MSLNMLKSIKNKAIDTVKTKGNIASGFPLETVLEVLQGFGQVTMGQYGEPNDRGWRCKVKMFVTAQGADFEVKTGFECRTPLSAAQECLELVTEVVEARGK